jgi:hypothetical protein
MNLPFLALLTAPYREHTLLHRYVCLQFEAWFRFTSRFQSAMIPQILSVNP